MHEKHLGATASLAMALMAAPTVACDICAIYTATEMRESRTGFRAGVAEQYSDYSTERLNGEEVPNPHGERLHSSITQVVLGYQLLPRVGLQLNLPIISRTFRRFHDGRNERGDETGVGDLSLVANVLAFDRVSDNSLFRFSLLGGLKLPSGDPDRIKEELEEGHHHEDGVDGAGDGHAEESSGLHGHDLALGSGSVDGIVGGSLFFSWHRLFVSSGLQYAVRTEGSFDYQYANDLTWSGGPGAYLLLTHDHTFSVQGVLSGETKGKDTLKGVKAGDTAITALYAGPSFSFTWGTALSAELAADLPVVQNNTQLQLVPDYRLRGAAIWRF
jgi:hypothetical protein